MSKEEIIEVLNSAYDNEELDYQLATKGSSDKLVTEICMRIFDYLSTAIQHID